MGNFPLLHFNQNYTGLAALTFPLFWGEVWAVCFGEQFL